MGSGVASVQIDPSPVYRPGVTENSKAFLMTRSGTDIRVKATLSGQNFSAPPHTAYTGLLKIAFDMKVLQDDSASSNNITINSGDTIIFDLAFEGGKISCNGAQKSSYEKNKWYAVEIVLDHQAEEYAVYLDGTCVCSRNKYAIPIDDPDLKPLDYMFFNIENADGSFYFDNYHISASDVSFTSQITQVEDVSMTTPSGTAPVLPDRVCAVYNTGEKTERTVVWETIEPSKYTSQGIFTVSGTVDGLSMPAKAVIMVLSEIREIVPVAVTITAGTAPAMPGTVTVTYKDGSTGSKAVTWDAIDPSEYASAGSFSVNGKVDGTDIKAVALVTVNAKDITIMAVRGIEVTTDAGTGPVLPEKVIVEYSDGTTGEKSVAWETIDPSEYASAGSFSVNGKIDGTDIGAVALVTVKRVDSIITSITPIKVSTVAGVFPVLPSIITVHFSDGTTGGKTVVWDTIDPSQYDSAGSFTVSGTVDGTDMEAKATVIVTTKTVTGISVRTGPDKISYTVGDVLDTSGLILFAEYNDGTEKSINSGFDTRYDFSKAGIHVVTVFFEGDTADFTVTVTEKDISDPISSSQPDNSSEKSSGSSGSSGQSSSLGASNKDVGNPRTGDNRQMILFNGLLICLSLITCAILSAQRKKHV